MGDTDMPQEYLSALIQCIVGFGFAGLVLLLSVIFGRRSVHRNPANIPYECGIVPQGDGSPVFYVRFYLVAALFLVFDLEVVFLYPWALVFKDFVINNAEAFISMTLFIVMLLVAYVYALAKGALVWHKNPSPYKP